MDIKIWYALVLGDGDDDWTVGSYDKDKITKRMNEDNDVYYADAGIKPFHIDIVEEHWKDGIRLDSVCIGTINDD